MEVHECAPGENELVDELTEVLQRRQPVQQDAIAALIGIAVQGLAAVSPAQEIYDQNVLGLIRAIIEAAPSVWNIEVGHRQRGGKPRTGGPLQ